MTSIECIDSWIDYQLLTMTLCLCLNHLAPYHTVHVGCMCHVVEGNPVCENMGGPILSSIGDAGCHWSVRWTAHLEDLVPPLSNMWAASFVLRTTYL